MKYRKNLLPQTPGDIFGFLLITICIPVTIIFEYVIVLPAFHDYGSFFYIFHVFTGIFILFNLKSNMIACILIDTSIKSELLIPPEDPNVRKNWRLCATCESIAPPRSWHCNTCNTCILKRDHHCIFTGCCVGHKNQRYFLMFLLFFFIGTLYTTIYNSVYFWGPANIGPITRLDIIKLICPMLILSIDFSFKNVQLLIYELNLIGCLFSLALIFYHMNSITHGATAYEQNSTKFNLGLKKNLEMILGKRMHLVWLSPFIKSDLPHDGIHWETVLDETQKYQ